MTDSRGRAMPDGRSGVLRTCHYRKECAVSGVIINGARHSYMSAALQIHQCMWCHNESKPGEPFFIVRYFGIKDGPVGSGGRSAVAAWRSAYEALTLETVR